MKIVDSHAHCGILDRNSPQSFEDYLSAIRGSPIDGAAMFSPVMEIYDRNDPFFKDTPSWRRQRKSSNEYLLGLRDREIEVFPYFFIWNDFAVDQLTENHFGIKWHRHDDEPNYQYEDPACAAAIEKIQRMNLPVVLEEEFANTMYFINELAGPINVIIPHLGMLNGGYRQIAAAGLWEKTNVWADSALASPFEIMDYITNYGHERLVFGSDYPFGHPPAELWKIRQLEVKDAIKEDICSNNLKRLYDQIRHVL